jgi:hypothetical protein
MKKNKFITKNIKKNRFEQFYVDFYIINNNPSNIIKIENNKNNYIIYKRLVNMSKFGFKLKLFYSDIYKNILL